MMYYNPTTKEIKSRYEIKKLFPSVSIKQDFDEFEGWYKLYDGELPEADSTHNVVEDGISKVSGKYTRKYKLAEKTEAEILEKSKEERRDAIEKLTVTVDGMVFDANETAQERMNRAITAHDGGTEIFKWVLADNSIVEIGVDVLKEALKKAVDETGKLWVKVYE